MAPNIPHRIGKIAVEIRTEDGIKPSQRMEMRQAISEALDDSFSRLVLHDRIVPMGQENQRLVIRLIETDTKYRFAGLKGISYGYARIFIDLYDAHNGAKILTGVVEGFESKSDTILLDHWLRRRFLKKAISTAIEKVAIELKGLTQYEGQKMELAKPAFLEQRLAVIPFPTGSQDAAGNDLGKLLTGMVITAVGQSRAFIVVEREQIDKVIEEVNFSHSGAVNEEQAQRMGKILGAEYLLVGRSGMKDKDIEIDMRILDAGTGKILASAGGTIRRGMALRYNVKGLVAKLVNAFMRGKARRW